MNRTSRSSRLVRSAARSPARAITGPEVARKLTPSSRATIWASVVLPRPGGPAKSTWSSASPRALAASMNTLRLARACAWPMNSDRVCGRRLTSASSPRASGARMRSVMQILREARRTRPVPESDGASRSLRQFPEPQADQRLGRGRVAGLLQGGRDGGARLDLAVTEIDQGRDRVRYGLRRPALRHVALEAHQHRIGLHGDRCLVLELRDDALGELRADARGAGQQPLVLEWDGAGELVRAHGRQEPERALVADALHGRQHTAPFALCGRGEAVEPDLVFAHHGLDRERG